MPNNTFEATNPPDEGYRGRRRNHVHAPAQPAAPAAAPAPAAVPAPSAVPAEPVAEATPEAPKLGGE